MTAAMDTADEIGDAFARRLRDVERAGRLRLRLTAARTEALEMARHHRYRRRDEPTARACEAAADAYQRWYFKVVRLQARVRGEAG